MTAAASESPSAHYSAYQGLGCDGSGIKLRTPDAFQHRVVDPQALLGQMVEVWALKQLLGTCGRVWNTSAQKWQET